MGNFLIKPVFTGGADGDGEDFYVLYGTQYWMPEAWGSREELEAMPEHAFSLGNPSRWNRADTWGTSWFSKPSGVGPVKLGRQALHFGDTSMGFWVWPEELVTVTSVIETVVGRPGNQAWRWDGEGWYFGGTWLLPEVLTAVHVKDDEGRMSV